MSVLRYYCFRWLVYIRALVFEPSRPLACNMMLVCLILLLELCCDIFPWVPDLDRTHLHAWLVYDWIGGVTSIQKKMLLSVQWTCIYHFLLPSHRISPLLVYILIYGTSPSYEILFLLVEWSWDRDGTTRDQYLNVVVWCNLRLH